MVGDTPILTVSRQLGSGGTEVAEIVARRLDYQLVDREVIEAMAEETGVQQALIEALDNDQLAAATLDVFHTEPLPESDPLWSHPKINLTSHTSFAGSGVRTRWQELFLDNLPRFVRGEPLINEVDPADL